MDLKPAPLDPALPRPPYFLRQGTMSIEGYKITKLSDLQREVGADQPIDLAYLNFAHSEVYILAKRRNPERPIKLQI